MEPQSFAIADLPFRNVLPYQASEGPSCLMHLVTLEPSDAVWKVFELTVQCKFREASEAASAYVDAAPDNGHAYLSRAIAAYELRINNLIISDLERSEPACSNHPLFHLYSGRVLRGKNAFDRSEMHFNRAIELSAAHQLKAEAMIGLALTQAAAKRTTEAQKTLSDIEALEGTTERLDLLKFAVSGGSTHIDDESPARSFVRGLANPKDITDRKLNGNNPRFSIDDRPLIVEYPFTLADVELTNHCPMKCVMCPRTNHMTRGLGHMSFETFKKIFDELAEANSGNIATRGLIWLHNYGESLVHPEFGRLIKYARSLNATVGLSVNPIMLADKTADRLLDAQPSALLLALDGHDNETFQKIRGIPDAYEKSKAQALKFIAKKHETGAKIRLHVIMVNFPKNSKSIAEMTEFWSNIPGVDQFIPKPFTTWDGSLDDINALAPSASDTAPRRACNYPWSKMSVLWNGDVVVCCHDFDGKNIIGNVNENRLLEIWNGPKMKALRAQMKARGVFSPVCQNCEYAITA